MTRPTSPDSIPTGSTNAQQESSALEERLKTLIAQRGPISVADYMADALSHPHEGYYMTASPIGAEGDFMTAPEISQIFGEIIGLWLLQSWLDIGSPEQFNLVELGPGRGVLMDDILRAARLRPGFIQAADIWLVETSGRLRHEQKKRLKLHKEADITWVDRFGDIPNTPTLIVANEFFDCLPIRQFEKTTLGWHERMVGIDPATNNLIFELAPAPSLFDHPILHNDTSTIGDIIETCEPAKKIAAQIAKSFSNEKSRILIIDYGNYSNTLGDTFQAVRNHKFWSPLSSPGKADLTAHVDFQTLGDAALHEGASVYGPVSQGKFLDRLGLSYRVESLCRGKSEEEQITIREGAHRLAAPAEMGELFKVMCIASANLEPPAGFE